MTVSLHLLELALAVVFPGYLLFFFAKSTIVASNHDMVTALFATAVTAAPLAAQWFFELIAAQSPRWVELTGNTFVGQVLRLGLIALCFGLTIWSPWERTYCTSKTPL